MKKEVVTAIEWFSVDEKLPKSGERILVYFDDGSEDILSQTWENPESRNFPGNPFRYVVDLEKETYKTAVWWASLDNLTEQLRAENEV